jgi:hypothetical protein
MYYKDIEYMHNTNQPLKRKVITYLNQILIIFEEKASSYDKAKSLDGAATRQYGSI